MQFLGVQSMTKKESLSSDIDLIKEFEELKLKQRLLIESLKKKTESQNVQLHKEINSKLDFLVKIFTEAQKKESAAQEDIYSKQFEELFSKIDSLDEKLEKVMSQKSQASNTQPAPQKDSSEDIKKSSNMPPLPDFKVENQDQSQKQQSQ